MDDDNKILEELHALTLKLSSAHEAGQYGQRSYAERVINDCAVRIPALLERLSPSTREPLRIWEDYRSEFGLQLYNGLNIYESELLAALERLE